MEIYRNDRTPVGISFPLTPISIDVTLRRNGVTEYVFPTVTATTPGYSVVPPYQYVSHNGKFSVHWKIEYEELGVLKTHYESTNVDVVTPILPLTEIGELAGVTDVAERNRLEARVRHTIEAITGRAFGLTHRSITLRFDRPTVFLQEPVLRVDHVIIGGMIIPFEQSGLVVDSEGWIVRAPTDWTHHFNYASYTPELSLYRNGSYTLVGEFGYRSIPSDIRLAAQLLVKDYSCYEDTYRTKGLEAVKAADWRFEYSKSALSGTGNLDVDRILSRYKGFGAAII